MGLFEHIDYVIPFALMLASMTVIYFQVYVILASSYCSRISCWERRSGADNTLIRWQVLSTSFGLIYGILSSMMWTPNLSIKTCTNLISAVNFFYSASMLVLYGFYESRLNVVRLERPRNRFEKFLLVCIGGFTLIPILRAALVQVRLDNFDGANFCVSNLPVGFSVAEFCFNIILNPGYLYCFVYALKNIEQWKSAHRRPGSGKHNNSSTSKYKAVIRRNLVATAVSTCATAGLAIFLSVVGFAYRQGELEIPVFWNTALRMLSVSVWCSCMFFCTLKVWRSKFLPSDKQDSSIAGTIEVNKSRPSSEQNNSNQAARKHSATDTTNTANMMNSTSSSTDGHSANTNQSSATMSEFAIAGVKIHAVAIPVSPVSHESQSLESRIVQ